MKEIMSLQWQEHWVPTYREPGYYMLSGCHHAPFINVPLFECFLMLMDDINSTGQLKGNLLIGDSLDMHSISRHNKGKIKIPGLTLEKEYAGGNEMLDAFDSINPNIKKLYFYGNHEAWYYNYMSEVDNAKLGLGVVKSPEEALHLKMRGYDVVTDFQNAEAKLGDLSLVHGVWCSKHAAHKHVTELKRNIAFVHTHRMGSWKEAEYEGYNIGWMGDKKAKVFNYMSKQQKEAWRSGFAVVYIDEDAIAHLTQLDWKNNKIVYGNKVYKA